MRSGKPDTVSENDMLPELPAKVGSRATVRLTIYAVLLAAAAVAVVLVVNLVQSRLDGLTKSNADGAIRAVLASQEAAWNAGDLDGFMAGYWKSDDLKFLSGDDVTTGWQATHDRYQKRYKGEGKEMGKLTFTVLDVDVVSGDAAIVRGRWGLVKSDGSKPHGLFTLLFRRIDGDWKIVSDHTSVAEK